MIDLNNLINLLPSYFKKKDTYKDEQGRGILERFLSVCGDYFKNEITPEIDNILDVMDLDFKTSSLPSDDPRKKYEHLFLNNLWEFLGEIPYGYSALYNNINPNNPWMTNASLIPRADCRRLLKYTISLYKIRGTVDFYNILLRFYGFSCKVLDPSGTESSPKGFNNRVFRDMNSVVLTDKEGKYQGIKEFGSGTGGGTITYDSDMVYDLSDYTYDSSVDCLGCSNIYITIGTGNKNLNTTQKQSILLLLNKFRPVNVVPFDLNNTYFANVNFT